MERYSVIHTKMPREFVLLQGTGCRWHQCSFCDYYTDATSSPYDVNREVLNRVTGIYGVLDVINSGSGIELDLQTLRLLKDVVSAKGITVLWFEMHYMYRHRLAEFAKQFAPVTVKFRCGIETFDAALRQKWNKGISLQVRPQDVARYFQGVCLLCCTRGETKERILQDISLARQYFEYLSINLFCNNTTSIRRDEELAHWFEYEIYPLLKNEEKIEILLNNLDLGVGE